MFTTASEVGKKGRDSYLVFFAGRGPLGVTVIVVLIVVTIVSAIGVITAATMVVAAVVVVARLVM